MAFEQIAMSLAVWSYPAVFLIMFVEDCGLPIPGHSFALLMAILAGQDKLNFPLIFVLTLAGGVLGNYVGYWSGYAGGRKLIERYGRFMLITSSRFAKAEQLADKHGAKMVLFARYLPFLCVWSGTLSGIARMDLRRFSIYNFAGMLLWCLSHMTLGFVLGRSSELLLTTLNGLGLAIIVAVLVIGGLIFLYRQKLRMKDEG